jgi:hypothetical protein
LSYGSKKFEGGLQKAEVALSDDAQQNLSTIFQSAVPPSKWGRWSDSHSRGENARQFTKLLLSLLSHIGGMGLPSIALNRVNSENYSGLLCLQR